MELDSTDKVTLARFLHFILEKVEVEVRDLSDQASIFNQKHMFLRPPLYMVLRLLVRVKQTSATFQQEVRLETNKTFSPNLLIIKNSTRFNNQLISVTLLLNLTNMEILK